MGYNPTVDFGSHSVESFESSSLWRFTVLSESDSSSPNRLPRRHDRLVALDHLKTETGRLSVPIDSGIDSARRLTITSTKTGLSFFRAIRNSPGCITILP